MTTWPTLPLRRVAVCWDHLRIPLNAVERADRQGSVPYWGANKVQDHVDSALVDADVVLLGEDGAPFFDRHRDVAFRVNEPIWPNNHIHVLKAHTDIDTRWLAYSLNDVDYSLYVVGSTRDKLTQAAMMSIELQVPSAVEQRAIADYLDRETAQIDAFIAKNEELITLLTERRAAEIDALLADDVPGRGALKLGWLFTFHNGDRGASYPSRDEFVSEGVPFINAGHLANGAIDYSEMNYISDEKFAEMGGAKLHTGDLLFCLRGSLGKLGVFSGQNSGALASSLVALRRRSPSTSVSYFAYLLQSSRARDAIDLAQTGTAQPNLSVDQLAQFRFAVPDPAAQRSIAARIAEVSESMDGAIETAARGIALARERRAALISAAVTGKIDVGVAA